MTAVARTSPLSWLANPILIKELLCASRRGRFYALRGGYIVALGFFVVITWLSHDGPRWTSDLPSGLSAAWMADLGKYVADTIAWFQFVAVQLVAVVLVAAAVTGEFQGRTLAMILTTPLTSGQIAVGHAWAGMQQVVLLLACSLPLLAITRVTGGVPFSFVVHSVAMTAAVGLLASAIAFHMALMHRTAGRAIQMSLLALLLFHGVGWMVWPVIVVGLAIVVGKGILRRMGSRLRRVVLPLGLAMIPLLYLWWYYSDGSPAGPSVTRAVIAECVSPGYNMVLLSQWLRSPTTPAPPMLAALLPALLAAGWLYFASLLLKDIGYLRVWGEPEPPIRPQVTKPRRRSIFEPPPIPGQEAGDSNRSAPLARGQASTMAESSPALPASGPAIPDSVQVLPPPINFAQQEPPAKPTADLDEVIRRWGSPIVWKDLRRDRCMGSSRVGWQLLMSAAAAIATLGCTSLIAVGAPIYLAIRAAVAITSERQARTWAFLMTTPLDESHIYRAKARVAFIPTIPIWAGMAIALFVGVLILGGLSRFEDVPMLLAAAISASIAAAGAVTMVVACGILVGTCIRGTGLAAVVSAGASLALIVIPLPCLGTCLVQSSSRAIEVMALVAGSVLAAIYFGIAGVLRSVAISRFRRRAF